LQDFYSYLRKEIFPLLTSFGKEWLQRSAARMCVKFFFPL
jgi:hypothetical protein